MNQFENCYIPQKLNAGTFHHFEGKSILFNCNALNVNEISQFCKNTIPYESRFYLRQISNGQYSFLCPKCQKECKIKAFAIQNEQLSLMYFLKEIQCIYKTYKALKQFNINACNINNSLYCSMCYFCKTQSIIIIDFGTNEQKQNQNSTNFKNRKLITKIIRVFVDQITKFIKNNQQTNLQLANEILIILTKIQKNSSLFYYYLNVVLNQQNQTKKELEKEQNKEKENTNECQFKKVELQIENSMLDKQKLTFIGQSYSAQVFKEIEKKIVQFRSHAIHQNIDQYQNEAVLYKKNDRLNQRNLTADIQKPNRGRRRPKLSLKNQNSKNPQKIAEQIISSINAYIESVINKIGQYLNETAILMHQYGIPFQFSMHLIYKEYFYLRAQLSLQLQDGQFEDHVSQLDWNQIKNNPLINPLIANTIAEIVKENKMIFQSLQFMLFKLKSTGKWNEVSNKQFYQIMIDQKEYTSLKYIKVLIIQTISYFNNLKEKIEQNESDSDQKDKEFAILYRFGCLIFNILKRYLRQEQIQAMYKYSYLKSTFAMKHEINEMAIDLQVLLLKSQ